MAVEPEDPVSATLEPDAFDRQSQSKTRQAGSGSDSPWQ